MMKAKLASSVALVPTQDAVCPVAMVGAEITRMQTLHAESRRSLLSSSAASLAAGAIAPAVPDPIYAALATWSEAVGQAWRDGTTDEEMEELVDAADTAAFAVIRTRPTTAHGLKILLIAAPEISRRAMFSRMEGDDGDDSMDITFWRHLAGAAAALLPNGPTDWLGRRGVCATPPRGGI